MGKIIIKASIIGHPKKNIAAAITLPTIVLKLII
jgi:hypothetical protein